jgi:Cu(I)/Ag(I) efflux system membrane protein CusA/SilA
MIPMAPPLVGGMTIELITLFITPVLYCWLKEFLWKHGWTKGHFAQAQEPEAEPEAALV